MRTVDLIHRKRDGEELSADEIAFLVDGYTSGTIPDYQMSAFLMAVFFSGMTDREVSALTDRTTVSMRARTPEPDRLIEVTRAAGFSPSRVADDVVVVAGARPETLGPVLADHRVVLYELTNDGSDLESVFMALTAPAVPATPEAPSAPLPFSPPVPRGTGP